MKKRHTIVITDDDYARLLAEVERQSLNSPTKPKVADVLHGLIQSTLPEAAPRQPSQKVKKKSANRARRLVMAEAIA